MFRLALALGKTLRELREIGSEELTYWMAYADLEPFGPLVDDFRAGSGVAMTYNMNRNEKSNALGASDFMPALKREMDRGREPEIDLSKLSPEKQAAHLDALFGFVR